MAMSIAPSAQAARKIASRRGSVLSELRGLALRVLGNATVTERLLLLLCVALLRRRDDRGIDNLEKETAMILYAALDVAIEKGVQRSLITIVPHENVPWRGWFIFR